MVVVMVARTCASLSWHKRAWRFRERKAKGALEMNAFGIHVQDEKKKNRKHIYQAYTPCDTNTARNSDTAASAA